MKVIVCGAGQVGFGIASHLAREGNDVTVVDRAASLMQRIRGGATPAREVACYEIGVLTAGASENKINVVREGLHLMGVARI